MMENAMQIQCSTLYWSCNGKMCLFIRRIRALQLVTIAHWLKRINANAYKTICMHKINAMVFSLYIYIRSVCMCCVCGLCTLNTQSSVCVCGICFRIQLYISIVLMMLLHAMCSSCKQFLSLSLSSFLFLFRYDFVHYKKHFSSHPLIAKGRPNASIYIRFKYSHRICFGFMSVCVCVF